MELGNNVTAKVDEKSKKLIITIDLAAEKTLSKSGKSMLLASTGGFQKVATSIGEFNLGLNLTTKV